MLIFPWHAVLAGSRTYVLLKDPDEVLGIFIAEVIRNLSNRLGFIENSFFRHIDDLPLDVFLSSLTCFFFNQVAKITRR
jgi:hypothetical protein